VCEFVFIFEDLEKRFGLGLASSRSRSRLVAKIRHLGLVKLQEGLGLSLVSDQKPNVSVREQPIRVKRPMSDIQAKKF